MHNWQHGKPEPGGPASVSPGWHGLSSRGGVNAKAGALENVLVRAYEQDGVQPGELAEAYALDPALVKSILAQKSAQYRMVCASEGNGEAYDVFSAEEYARVRKAYFSLAMDTKTTPPGVRERALRNIINEVKGRNDLEAALNVTNVNILHLNKRLQAADDTKNKAREAVLKARNLIPDAEIVTDAPPVIA